jgi:aminopeptidase-like protein
MMDLLKKIAPLNRTLACKATDEALSILTDYLPGAIIEGYKTSSRVWSWNIPKRWELTRATIKRRNGEILVDSDWHHLHVMNYSIPFSGVVSHSELMAHIYTSKERPEAIPFHFNFYEEKWGFCVPDVWLNKFQDDEYLVEIDSHLEDGMFNILSKFLPGKLEETFIICANICHPTQANDSLTGLVAAVEIIKNLEQRTQRKYSYLLLVVPETIGSVAYLANHPEVIEASIGAFFSEMLGTSGNLVGQKTRKGNTYWDKLLELALADSGLGYKTVPFMKSASNDEKVLDSPGVDIPTFSLTRYPYAEYHTSDDNFDLINEERIRESIKVLQRVIDLAEEDYIPVLNQPGPIFLSGNGIFPDWRANLELLPYWNSFIEVMYSLDSNSSLVDLAFDKSISLSHLQYWLDAFESKGLLNKKPYFLRRNL